MAGTGYFSEYYYKHEQHSHSTVQKIEVNSLLKNAMPGTGFKPRPNNVKTPAPPFLNHNSKTEKTICNDIKEIELCMKSALTKHHMLVVEP